MNPGVPQNGLRRGESFQVGSPVFYSCNRGYQLYGSRGRFCVDLGQWTGNLPSCLRQCSSVYLFLWAFDSSLDVHVFSLGRFLCFIVGLFAPLTLWYLSLLFIDYSFPFRAGLFPCSLCVCVCVLSLIHI